MMHRQPIYTKEEREAMRELIRAAGQWLINRMFPKNEAEEVEVKLVPLRAADPREDFNLAINFAVDVASIDAAIFLKSWREGDWNVLRNEWPEWVAYCKARGIDA